MTILEFAATLSELYPKHQIHALTPAKCRHAALHHELQEILTASKGMMTATELGRSAEGRVIRRVTIGTGPISVLLWSQMHGDEPTATLALLDIFSMLSGNAHAAWVRQLLEQVTIHAIPMLNPDGAERFRRYTAAEIDMNRDARALVTPEARILREAQRSLRPSFGFNLHDQGLSSVGDSTRVAAVSLLAPAVDPQRTMPLVRVRAVRVGALVAKILHQFVDGHVATYDDAFEPRAFGDSMQAWGTSTLLIESGHWPGDPEKRSIRKLNVVAILAALRAIGDGTYQEADLDFYRQLQQNGKRMFDIVVRGLTIRMPEGRSASVDLGLLVAPSGVKTVEFPGEGTRYAIKEIGDLKDFGALQSMDASARSIDGSLIGVDRTFTIPELRDTLQL